MFESSVNPEGSKTRFQKENRIRVFESSVNPEGSKTQIYFANDTNCLRVV